MTTETYVLPTDWACYLINGDPGHFELYDDCDEQLALIDNIVANIGGYCCDVGQESWFAKYHDAHHYGVLAGTVSEFTFIVD